MLFLAKTFDFQVKEVPVQWSHREGGGIHPLRDGLRMVAEIIKIRWNSVTGKYTVSQVVA